MKILIFNWRDIKNPSSGGAEILTHEVAKRWVDQGNQVTWVSSVFPHCKKEEVIDGVLIIRAGFPDARYLFRSTHFKAFLYYLRYARGKIDVVIDEIHGVPYFTPWYVREKKIVLICEVAGSLWRELFGVFVGFFGKIVEKFFLRFVYNNLTFITISSSTKEDLIKNGVKEKRISVLPMGITLPKRVKIHKKEKNPTLIFVGRLSPSKGVTDAIMAFKKICSIIPNARLWIVGRGEKSYVDSLIELSKRIHLFEKIFFFGFVSDYKKFNLMNKAHILIVPSRKEGWGLVVPEAGLMGTPAVVYNVSGLRDIIHHRENGMLCDENTPEEIARNVGELLKNSMLYKKIQRNLIEENKIRNWDYTAEKFLKLLK